MTSASDAWKGMGDGTVGAANDPARDWVLAGDIPDPDDFPFLVGTEEVPILHDSSNMLFGRPEAGKSMTWLSLGYSLESGEPFMGTFPVLARRRVAVWTLDPAQARETKRRINKFAPEKREVLNRLLLTSRRTPSTADGWEDEARRLADRGVNFIFIDNLNRLKSRYGASIRNDDDMGIILDQIDMAFGGNGIGYCLVHHLGKPGEDGLSKTSPMGATDIEGWARHFQRIEVQYVRGTNIPAARVLHVYGNEVLVKTPDPIPFTIVNDGLIPAMTPDQVKEAKKQANRDASREKRDERGRWVLDNYPAEANRSVIARAMEAAGYGAVGSHRNRLSDGGYGIRWNGDKWEWITSGE
jgi:hypothetical protein